MPSSQGIMSSNVALKGQYKKEDSNKRSTKYQRQYVKTTLPKCYNPPLTSRQAKENMAKLNGYRRYYLCKDGGLYRGWWKNNMKHGLGKEINKKTNEIYEGEFFNDKRNGNGILSEEKPNGLRNLLCVGKFKNGVSSGRGELHTSTYHYIGNIVNGVASGSGVATFKDGSFYCGSWFEGKRMGEGMLVLKNRNRFEGTWDNDIKNGHGHFFFFDRGQAMEGIWYLDVFITGIIRNVKYRQAAFNPVKYPIPQLMLKDWIEKYYKWENEAFEKLGQYVAEKRGISLDDEVSEDFVPKGMYFEEDKSEKDVTEKLLFVKEPPGTEPPTKFPQSVPGTMCCVVFK